MKILIINGAPAAGKSTFTRILKKIVKQRLKSYSSIDWVKEMAEIMGWDGIKDEKGRQFLYDIKQASIAYDDAPINRVFRQVVKAQVSEKYDYFCTDIREPSEIRKLKRICRENAITCYTVLIKNKKAEAQLQASNINNPADNETQSIPYDIVISNNANQTRLKRHIEEAHADMEGYGPGQIFLQDDALFNLTGLESDIKQADILNSDQYQNIIDKHYSELPKPKLSQDSIMLLINALSLCGEAGEIANAIKKITWYKHGEITQDDIDHIQDEIGDTLYHSAQLATITKTKLSGIMQNSALKCINRGNQGFENVIEKP